MPDYQPDAHGRAFREMEGVERYLDIELGAHSSAEHASPADLDDLLEEIKLPHVYEAEMWDAGRESPKTGDEARAALARRIADRAAPDGPEAKGVYDDFEEV